MDALSIELYSLHEKNLVQRIQKAAAIQAISDKMLITL